MRATAFVVLTCAAILGVSVWREWSARDELLGAARTELENLARSLTQHADDSLDLLDASVIGATSRLEIEGLDAASIGRVRLVLAARKSLIPRLHGLDVADANGRWLTAPGTVADTFDDDECFRHHMLSDARKAFVGRPIRSRVDGEWVIPLSRRFNHPDGSFAGVVVATISANHLSAFYRQFEIGRNGSIALVHADGRIVARTPDGEKFAGRDISERPLFNDIRMKQQQSGVYAFSSPLDGLERVGAFRRSSRYPVILFVTNEKDALLASWRASAAARMSFVLALVALIAIIGALLVRHLRRGQRMAAALAQKEANFRLVAEGSSDMVTRIGLDERIHFASPSSIGVVGWRAAQLIGTPALAGVNPADLPRVRAIVEAMKRGEQEEARVTYRNAHRERSEIWLESALRVTRTNTGEIDGVVAISRDITEQKNLENRLEALAIADGLTGLANRRRFDERLAEEWARAYRERSSLGLLMLDLDHFKSYNDLYGHPAGDACLRVVAGILAREAHRATDLAARYGGEEFAVLLPNTDAAACARMGERILQAIRDARIAHSLSQPSGHVTASVGVAACRPALELWMEPASLVEVADRALYGAKQAGRDRVMMATGLNLLPIASGQ